MARIPIQVGERTFSSKKEAILHYRAILHTYDFWESISPEHFEELVALYEFHNGPHKLFDPPKLVEIGIAELQYKTKGFAFVFEDDTYMLISYLQLINGGISPLQGFRNACQRAIRNDIRSVKQSFFDQNSKQGKVRCMETGEWCKWEELNVDHRQPNTFSVIVDRFIEVHSIDFEKVEYSGCEDGGSEFADTSLSEKFREYHRQKANLRIVKKERNNARAHQGRIGTVKKDLRID